MKKNSFIWLISLLIFSSALAAQSNGIEFYHYNSDNIRILESILQYNASPLAGTNVSVLGQSSWEDRLNFNQDIRRSLLGSSFSYLGRHFHHTMMMDYESYYDVSDLEPTAYINKNGRLGYQLYWSPADSLSFSLATQGLIRNEQDRYLQDTFRHSDGLHMSANSSYQFEHRAVGAGIHASAERKDMDWEAYQNVSLGASINAHTNSILWDSSFNISRRLDDIFNLIQDQSDARSFYQKQDEQKRTGLNISTNFQFYPKDQLSIILREDYSEKRTILKENTIRNNGEFFNDMNLGISYDIMPNLNFNISANHLYSIKDFNIAQNMRHVENRILNISSGWEYSPYDSLFAGLGISLQRTSFPENEDWDNDLRNKSARLGWKHYYRDHVRFANWFIYSYREDVYTSGLLSANNHNLESFSYQPAATILFGDRIAFSQEYQIRTDYTDYMFHEKRTDLLFRQLACRYNLVFDSYPYVARSGDDLWFAMPYRSNKGSALLTDLGFSYEENQSAQKELDYYDINYKNRKYIGNLTIKHDVGDFYYFVQPQYSWGTWQEYSLKAGTFWNFDNGSYLEFNLTPISEDLKEIDWRSSVNLSIIF